MGLISDIFNLILIDPLTNLFVLLATATGNAGYGVILLTIIIRILTLPMTLGQMRSMRMMAVIQPRMAEIQKRHKDPKRRSAEQMKLYKEAGINPLGCFSSMILQLPILAALYRTFTVAVGESPEAVIKVSTRLYNWDYLRSNLPLNGEFIWLHLGRPDPLVLPILVAATTYILQKMTMMPTTDPKQQAQNSMMNMLMPLLFGWITLSLPSGLGLYYVLSNVIGAVMQYAYVGGGPLNWRAFFGLSQDPVLPKALEVRQKQLDKLQDIGGSDEDDGQSADETSQTRKTDPAAQDTPAARRRRRYASGKRRGRR